MEGALRGAALGVYAAMPAATDVLRELKCHLGLEMTLLSDPQWQSHHAFELHRGTVADVFLSAATWRSYGRAIGSGRFHFPRQDILQLGGVAIVRQAQEVVWLYRSRNSTDYALPTEVARQVKRASAADAALGAVV